MMKKNIFTAAFVAAIGIFAGYNVHNAQNKEVMSDITLANVEALASGEVIIGTICVTICKDCWCYYPDEDFWADGEPWNI